MQLAVIMAISSLEVQIRTFSEFEAFARSFMTTVRTVRCHPFIPLQDNMTLWLLREVLLYMQERCRTEASKLES